jgi:hypothetical protein
VEASSGARKPPLTPIAASERESCSTASIAENTAIAASSANTKPPGNN